jgi:lipopolysaccharide transport system permease protein
LQSFEIIPVPGKNFAFSTAGSLIFGAKKAAFWGFEHTNSRSSASTVNILLIRIINMSVRTLLDTFLKIFLSLKNNRSLIWQLTKREVLGRYRGSFIGLAWSFINPLIMLAVYTFVFSVVFNARWNISTGESRFDFAIILFAGMIVYSLFAEVINRAPVLIIANPNYVKKVVFPLEILTWVSIGSSLFQVFISINVLLIVQLILNQKIVWTIVLFPIVIFPLILICIGLSWFLASLGVYIRDVGQITNVITTVLLFISAVFYPISALPESYQVILMFNPLVFIITESRNVLLFGILPDWSILILYTLIGIVIAFLGLLWFEKTRKGFADVI